MTVIHISESDAVRDFASVLAYVRAGSEVVIESERAPVAVLVPPAEGGAPDAGHDAWFRSRVQQALDDSRPDASDDEVEAHFARRRASSLLRSTDTTR